MLKVPLLGEGAVGKTTLVRAFMGGTISDRYSPTLGVEIGRKTVVIDIDAGPAQPEAGSASPGCRLRYRYES